MASLRQAEAQLKAAMPVLHVEKGEGYIDCACQGFNDSIWRALGAAYDVEMRGSYVKPENKKRKPRKS